MFWPFKKSRKPEVCKEALAAKIQSEIDYKVAQEELIEAKVQAAELQLLNKRNHFSEKLEQVFKEKPA